ncbi:MAG: selenocysteine-specific translation elongation factor [Candidatus Cloacimonetes bacterium]|nr:selenocysteine-specific translation elongation factor [Candidatus Cloacimonadota bacterium]
MKHLIMGTAGHIDHGKTTLIQKLTGAWCDTHKEEELRGITISLGFTHLDLPSGNSLGVVDVPGHADFIGTMVAGASGIDFALLVVATDEGVMPQTREHLAIMQTLQIQTGLVALTKSDLVDDEVIELAREEICELTGGSFLEDCPIVPVSSRTGAGLDELVRELEAMPQRVPERAEGHIFRLFIDRHFSVPGHGTVVNGSVLSGCVRREGQLYMLPGAQKLRVRRLERHGREVDEVRTGDRAALNLPGLDRADVHRGMALSDRVLQPTGILDAHLRLFAHGKALELWSQVNFLLGTVHTVARVHLIDRNRLEGGDAAIVQIHLDQPLIAMHGDCFVIRSSSGDRTLGGGEIFDPQPLHHRRRPEKLIERLREIAEGGLPELVAAEVRKRVSPVGHERVADLLGASAQEVLEVVSHGLSDDILTLAGKEKVYLWQRKRKEKMAKRVVRNIELHHKRNPLVAEGRSFEELMGLFGVGRDPDTESAMHLLLDELIQTSRLKREKHTWTLPDHSVKLDRKDWSQIDFVDNYLRNEGMHLPLLNNLIERAAEKGFDEGRLRQILRLLVHRGRAYYIEGNWIHAHVVDGVRQTLLKRLVATGEPITVADFRDLVKGNRRMCLPLINQFDKEGVTTREGDYRHLTRKGSALVEQWEQAETGDAKAD